FERGTHPGVGPDAAEGDAAARAEALLDARGRRGAVEGSAAAGPPTDGVEGDRPVAAEGDAGEGAGVRPTARVGLRAVEGESAGGPLGPLPSGDRPVALEGDAAPPPRGRRHAGV